MIDQTNTQTSRIDLSSVPEPMRSMLLKQLDKMPAPLREQLLREGSPMLDKLIAKARSSANHGTTALPASAAKSDSVHVIGDHHDQGLLGHARNEVGTFLANAKRVPTISPGDSANHGPLLLISSLALAGAIWYALQG